MYDGIQLEPPVSEEPWQFFDPPVRPVAGPREDTYEPEKRTLGCPGAMLRSTRPVSQAAMATSSAERAGTLATAD
jgi:hypothetical protein